MAINNRLSYGRTIFYLDSIDNIYFYTPFRIEGIDELKSFWELSNINFEVLPIEEVNILDKLILEYNIKHYENDDINFSIFPRPPKFYKTKTFQLIASLIATILIFGGDFGYRFYTNSQLQLQNEKLSKQIKIKEKRLANLEKINKKILKEVDKYTKEIEHMENDISLIKKVLEKSIDILNLPKINKDFINISNLLQKNHLQTFFISEENKTISLGVYTHSKYRNYIPKFMNDLARYKYKKIQTDKISKINGYYISVLRFDK